MRASDLIIVGTVVVMAAVMTVALRAVLPFPF